MTLETATAQALLAQLDAAARVHEVTPVARGAMGEVSRVDTTTGTYAVKELFAWNQGEGIAEEVRFTARARAAGVRIPMEIPARDGSMVCTAAGRRFRMYEWVSLLPPAQPPVAPAVAEQVGRLVGTLHLLAEHAPGPCDPWYTTPVTLAGLRELADTAAGRGAPWSSQLAAALPLVTSLLASVEIDVPAPMVLCHGDLDPSNVLATVDGDLVVLDWENLGPMQPEQELGYVLLSWCTQDGIVQPESVVALLHGHARATATTVLLRRSAFRVATVTWLNFLDAMVGLWLADEQPPEQRAFAASRLEQMLTTPLTVGVIDEVLAIGQRHPLLCDGVVLLDRHRDTDVAAHVGGEDEETARRFGWWPERSTEETVRRAYADWARSWDELGPCRTFACRDAVTGLLVGGCELRLQDDGSGQVSYWTHAGERGRGYASRALALLCEYADRLGVTRLESHVAPDNAASRGVAMRAGFVEDGDVTSPEGEAMIRHTRLAH